VIAAKGRRIITEAGALITGSHVVMQSGRHTRTYVDKDVLYAKPHLTRELCESIVTHFYTFRGITDIEAVAAPEKGGIALAQWCAYVLTRFFEDQRGWMTSLHGSRYQGPREAAAVFAERQDGRFVIRSGFTRFVSGKKVLVVDDILTTGWSVRGAVEAVKALGGNVVGVAALWNRGGVSAYDVGGVHDLFSVVDERLEDWDEEPCSPCKEGVPINTDVGYGKDYLERKRAKHSLQHKLFSAARLFLHRLSPKRP
jgi:orotate phosphoribosyltransferase